MKQCYKCGTEWTEKHTPNFRDECEKCFTPLCVCKNCKFYREDSYEWCAETEARAEKPRDSEVANKCDYFLMNDRHDDIDKNANNAKQKLAELFGDDTPIEEKKDADWMKVDNKKSIDDIFKT